MSLDELLDADEAFSDRWWDFAAEEKLIGRVVKTDSREDKYGVLYPVLTILTGDGERVAVHAFQRVLKDQLQQQSVQVGDHVGFKYLGQREAGSGFKYHAFKVVKARTDEEFSGE